jgi:TRAP-type C4-dicarboxylate transport system permease small subunit
MRAERAFARLERWLLALLAGLLALITAGVFIQVVLRYGFARSFLWGEELALFAFIWCVYLGAAICTWRRSHFAFDLFAGRLSGRAAGVQQLAVDLCVLLVAAVMLVQGAAFAELSVQRLSPALGITLLVPTLAIPLSGGLMVLAALAALRHDLRLILTGRAG